MPLAVVTVVLVVASFTWGVAQTAAAQPLAYFLPTTRAWELGVGALLALAAPLACRLPPLVRPWLAVGGLAAVVGACVVLDEETPFPGTAALLPVLGTAAVVLAGTGGGATTAVARVLGLAPLQVLGRLSYGWYLWHWPVLLLAPRVLGADPDLPSRLLLAAAALGLAALTYALVEDPVRRHRALVAAPARSLAVGAACVVVAVGTAGAAGALLPQVRGSGPAQASVATGDGEEVALLGAVDAGKMLRRTPANLVPALDVAGQDVARARNADGVSCMVGVEHRDITREPGGSCVFGDHPSGPTTVVLTGDSHAYQWYPALERIADERGWRLVVMTKAGCPLYDVELVNRTLRRDYTECYEWRDAAMARIAQERPDLVVVSAAVFSPRDAAFVDRWAQGVATTTTALRASSGAVVSLQDTPIPGRDVPRCLAEHLDDVQACAVPREDALTDPARRSATAEAAAGSGATVVDPVPWFCDETCPPIIGNTLAYHDGDHITATYAEQLAPLLAEELVAAMHPGDRT